MGLVKAKAFAILCKENKEEKEREEERERERERKRVRECDSSAY